MNVCIVFDSKYSKTEAIVSQTMGRDAQGLQSIYGYTVETQLRGQGGLAPPFSQVTKKF